jgi:ankyrin repeat protein
MPNPQINQELLHSIETGDVDLAQTLAFQVPDLNLRGNDPDGETLLMRAVSAGQVEIVQILLRAGADVNCAGKLSGCTPLMLALSSVAMLRGLLTAGPSLEARTIAREVLHPATGKTSKTGGQTALHLAVATNNCSAAHLLIEAGADVEALDAGGLAPLDFALRNGAPTEAALLLMQAGAVLTMERRERALSAAHSPDSDLWQFPWSADEQGAALDIAPNQQLASPKPPPAQELRCPQCHSLIYSRKPKICGQCGALLPSELLIGDEEARTAKEGRAWAQNLADSLGAPLAGVKPASSRQPAGSPAAKPGPRSCRPSDLLESSSYPQQFAERHRPRFWVDAMFYLTIALGFAFVLRSARISPAAILPVFALLAFCSYLAWKNANPVCPACNDNIRTCATRFCHVCGDGLQQGKCSTCAVNYCGLELLHPFTSYGNRSSITFCPSCGTRLDTRISRRRDTRGI